MYQPTPAHPVGRILSYADALSPPPTPWDLAVGDLSYADGYQPRWDSWGRMVEPHTSSATWMFTGGAGGGQCCWCGSPHLLCHPLDVDWVGVAGVAQGCMGAAAAAALTHRQSPTRPSPPARVCACLVSRAEGNHEIETKNGEPEAFLAYRSRFYLPHHPASSASPFYYSYEVAGAHIVALGSYEPYGPSSEQFEWLRADLAAVDRWVGRGRGGEGGGGSSLQPHPRMPIQPHSTHPPTPTHPPTHAPPLRRELTPWLLVAMHAPWYSSNENHQGEGEFMRRAMERLLYEHGADIVLSGGCCRCCRRRRCCS